MAYIECPKCGQKALSVATRCPRCGEGFPAELLRHPDSKPKDHRLRSVMRIAAALVAVVVVTVLLVVMAVQHPARPRAVAVPPVAAVAAPLDTAPAIPAQPRGEILASAGDSAPSLEPPPPAVVPPAGEELQRYATTWVNGRGGRNPGAPAVRVSDPGETVLVDSLRLGWYYVLVEGRTLGNVHRSYLDAVPPSARP